MLGYPYKTECVHENGTETQNLNKVSVNGDAIILHVDRRVGVYEARWAKSSIIFTGDFSKFKTVNVLYSYSTILDPSDTQNGRAYCYFNVAGKEITLSDGNMTNQTMSVDISTLNLTELTIFAQAYVRLIVVQLHKDMLSSGGYGWNKHHFGNKVVTIPIFNKIDNAIHQINKSYDIVENTKREIGKTFDIIDGVKRETHASEDIYVIYDGINVPSTTRAYLVGKNENGVTSRYDIGRTDGISIGGHTTANSNAYNNYYVGYSFAAPPSKYTHIRVTFAKFGMSLGVDSNESGYASANFGIMPGRPTSGNIGNTSNDHPQHQTYVSYGEADKRVIYTSGYQLIIPIVSSGGYFTLGHSATVRGGKTISQMADAFFATVISKIEAIIQ